MKVRITALVAGLFCAFVLAFAQDSNAASDFKGNWTITTSDQAGMVRFGLMHRMHGGHSQHESDWPATAFTGLSLSERGKRDVQFNVTRDAGRFDCEGYLNDGDGAGIFRFTPDSKYPAAMKSLGFTGIDDEKQFAMAVHDVTLEFARQMKGENLIGLDTDKLIAFRIFNVSAQFIQEVRKAGLDVNADKLIAMRVHGATPEWIAQMKTSGYAGLDADAMIAFRVHGVSPEFIEKLQTLGFQHPEPDQLIAMRVHGVTPEFISDLKSRGVKNLSIDQMINLRVHGID